MKAYLTGVLALAACSIMAFAPTVQAEEWYKGGTLHKASVAHRYCGRLDTRDHIQKVHRPHFRRRPGNHAHSREHGGSVRYHLNGRYEIQQRQRLNLCSAVHGHDERAK